LFDNVKLDSTLFVFVLKLCVIFKTEARSGSGIGLQFPELKPNSKIIAAVIIRNIFI